MRTAFVLRRLLRSVRATTPTSGSEPNVGAKAVREANAMAPPPVAAGVSLIALSCGFYMVCSIAMNLANKMLADLVHLPLTALAAQMVVAVLTLGPIALLPSHFPGMVYFGSWRDARRWALVVPPLFAASLSSSHLALSNASLGLTMILRFIGPLLTAVVEHAMGHYAHADRYVALSQLVSLAGVGLYISRVEVTRLGLTYGLLNLLFTMAEQLATRQLLAITPVDVSFGGLLLLNNGIALPVVAALLYSYGEQDEWASRLVSLHATGDELLALGFLTLSCLGGLVIGWSAMNAQQHITATAMLVLSNVDKALIILGGMLLLDDAHGVLNLLGMGLALGGGVLFGSLRIARQPGPAGEGSGAEHESAVVKGASGEHSGGDSVGNGGGAASWLLRRSQQARDCVLRSGGIGRADPSFVGTRGAVTLSCGIYSLCNVGMNLVNKELTSFDLPLSVVVVQIIVAIAILLVLPLEHRFGSRGDVMRWACGVSLLWGAKMSTSMLAMQNASLGLLMVLRTAAPLITLFVEGCCCDRIPISWPAVLALLLIVLGVIVYVLDDVLLEPLKPLVAIGTLEAATPPLQGQQSGGSAIGAAVTFPSSIGGTRTMNLTAEGVTATATAVLPGLTHVASAAVEAVNSADPRYLINPLDVQGGQSVGEELRPQWLAHRLLGLFWVIADVALGVLARLLQRRMLSTHPVDISFAGMLLLNNGVALLPEAAMLFLSREPQQWAAQLRAHPADAVDWALLAMSCVLGLAIGWASINAQQHITATAMQAIGTFNRCAQALPHLIPTPPHRLELAATHSTLFSHLRLAIIFCGMLFLGERYSPTAASGLALALGGAIWFTMTPSMHPATTRAEQAGQPGNPKDVAAAGPNGHSGDTTLCAKADNGLPVAVHASEAENGINCQGSLRTACASRCHTSTGTAVPTGVTTLI